MISPDTFYEMNLKGKTEEEIVTTIFELGEEIDRLKKIVEDPNYVCTMHPSERVQISCLKDYVQKAKQELKARKSKN